MGLDMYLHRDHHVRRWDHIPDEQQFEVVVKQGGEPYPHFDPARAYSIIELVGYWRKANHIHHWFVENIQGGVDECQRSYVEPEKLKDLLILCQRLDAVRDPEEAADALPPQSGFFFGGTEIDDYYWSQVERTIEICERALSVERGDLYYQSSW